MSIVLMELGIWGSGAVRSTGILPVNHNHRVLFERQDNRRDAGATR